MPDVNSLAIKFKEVVYTSASIFRHNVLFLSEGFSAAEEGDFDKAVSNIVHHFLNISPFCIANDHDGSSLKNFFNFFKAFIPSPSSGISIDVPLNNTGEPKVDGSKNPPYNNRMAEKNSVFGLIYKEKNNRLVIEEKPGYKDFVKEVVAKLKYKEKISETAIPQCWLEPSDVMYSGKDNGLVCVLVNDTYYKAYTLPWASFKKAIITMYDDDYFDMTPDKTDHIVLRTRKPDYITLASTLAHEFGHSYFNLGDEYVNLNYTENKSQIEGRRNIAHVDELDPLFSDFPDISIKWLADRKLTGQFVIDYMVQNKKPLCKHRQGDMAMAAQKPEDAFLNHHIHPFPSDIIGLYQGADFSFTEVYRPSGRCNMRSGFDRGDYFFSASLDRLPMDIGLIQNSYFRYISEQKLLVYATSDMLLEDVQEMLSLADPASDPDAYKAYKEAVELLYTISNDDKNKKAHKTRFTQPFCLVCKYHIVMKLTENLLGDARNWFLEKLFQSVPKVKIKTTVKP